MAEKKVKRVRKTEKAPLVSPCLAKLNSENIDPITITFNIGEETFDVHVKQHVDFAGRSAIIDKLEDIYCPVGGLDEMYGDSLIEFLLMQVYTDLEFVGDFNLFDRFRYEHSDIYNLVTNAYPLEVEDLRSSINKELVNLRKEKVLSVEEKQYYASASAMYNSLRDVANSIVGFLTNAESTMKDVDVSEIKDLISAMSFAGKADEGRVARAVLDFQREKEKRVAVKSESEHVESIPHI